MDASARRADGILCCSICGDLLPRGEAGWIELPDRSNEYAHGACWHTTTAIPHIESDLIIQALRASAERIHSALVERLNELGRAACRSCAHVPERSRSIMSCGCLHRQQATGCRSDDASNAVEQ